MTIALIARLQIREGKEEEFEQVFAELTAAVRANEEGNLLYALHRSRNDPQTYVVLEQYADQAAVEAHQQSEHFRTIGARMGPCLGGAPSIEALDGV